MISQDHIIATPEELQLLRDKFNQIKDIPYLLENKNKREGFSEDSSNQDAITFKSSHHKVNKSAENNEEQTIQQLTKINIELQQKIQELTVKINNEKLHNNNEESLTKENEDVKLNLQKRGFQISDDYIENDHICPNNFGQNMKKVSNNEQHPMILDNTHKPISLKDYSKIKAENVLYKEQIKELNYKNFNLEKHNQMIQFTNDITNEKDYSDNNYFKLSLLSLLNKNRANDKCMQTILQLFKNDKQDLVKFLFNRIDALEFQNYQLLTKIESYQHTISQITDDTCEYIHVICDIMKVLNGIPTSNMDNDLVIIRDTLQQRENLLSQQMNILYERKTQIEEDFIKDNNLQIIVCQDKMIEAKSILVTHGANIHFEKYIEAMNERISVLESLRDTLAKYEEFVQAMNDEIDSDFEQRLKFRESLLKDNSFLKSNNLKLKTIIIELLSNKEITFNDNILKRINKTLNEINPNVDQYDDLLALLRCQAGMIEKQLY